MTGDLDTPFAPDQWTRRGDELAQLLFQLGPQARPLLLPLNACLHGSGKLLPPSGSEQRLEVPTVTLRLHLPNHQLAA